MRTFIILALLIVLNFGVHSQNLNKIEKLPEIEFGKTDTLKNQDYFKISPLFENQDTLQLFLERKKWLDSLYNNFKLAPKQTEPLTFSMPNAMRSYNSLNMPIKKPKGNYWNMPVWVPDSTVNYSIKQAIPESQRSRNQGR